MHYISKLFGAHKWLSYRENPSNKRHKARKRGAIKSSSHGPAFLHNVLLLVAYSNNSEDHHCNAKVLLGFTWRKQQNALAILEENHKHKGARWPRNQGHKRLERSYDSKAKLASPPTAYLIVSKDKQVQILPKDKPPGSRKNRSSSHAWRGILQGNQLLKTGLIWNVGNGKRIRVWKDNWLPLDPPRPTNRIRDRLIPDLKVKDLFIPGTTHWHNALLCSLIDPKDIPLIKRIRPFIAYMEDQPTWIHNKDGLYSVKSGYKLLHNQVNHNAVPSHDNNFRKL